jgi:hypothetical protein
MAWNAVKRGFRLSPASWKTIWIPERCVTRANFRAGMPPNLGAIESDAAATGINEVRDEPHQGRLAATGLPDKTERLARSYRKSTLSTAWSQLWRARRQKWCSALYREMLGQAADLEDRLSHKGCQQATTCDWPGRGDDTAQYVAPDGVGSAADGAARASIASVASGLFSCASAKFS